MFCSCLGDPSPFVVGRQCRPIFGEDHQPPQKDQAFQKKLPPELPGIDSAVVYSSPIVAVLLNPEGVEEGLSKLVGFALILLRSNVQFHDEGRLLILLQDASMNNPLGTSQVHLEFTDGSSSGYQSRPIEDCSQCTDDELVMPAKQIRILRSKIHRCLDPWRPSSGPYTWPLHNLRVKRELRRLAVRGADRDLNRWRRVLIWLRIYVRPGGSQLLQLLKNLYGGAVAYSFAWADYYVHMLWGLAVMAAIALIANAQPEAVEGWIRAPWEVYKVAIVLWTFGIAVGTRSKHNLLRHAQSEDCCKKRRNAIRNPSYNPNYEIKNKLLLYIIAKPLLLLFSFLVGSILLLVLQINIFLTWDWGDCLRLGCFDPEEKHGFWGWLAEVCSDILLAIVFEGLLSLAKVAGEKVATLQNHEWLDEHKAAAIMHSVIVEALGKVGPFVLLAFLFVPEWSNTAATARIDADCSDIPGFDLVGVSYLPCLRRKLSPEVRRFIFVRTTKGPFIVAPFVAILMKVIVPWVAERFEETASVLRCRCSVGVLRGITRILALIFSYDSESVGCLSFLRRGWPFGAVSLEVALPSTEQSGSRVRAILSFVIGLESDDPDGFDLEADTKGIADQRLKATHKALRQSIKKQFDPLDELLELKLSFLFVAFFAPVRPVGVFPTLAARLLETHADLTKMLFVRRRPFPESAHVAHTTQEGFAWGTAIATTIWSIGLSLITYNNNLWRWV